jgi:hypothetical protein
MAFLVRTRFLQRGISMIERHALVEPRRASWGSIFGGAVTVLAVSVLLAMLGGALGFGMVDAQSQDPVGGIGTAFGIWTGLSLLISLAAGGFVAGYLAGEAGWVHGFLAWATALLLAIVFSAMAIGGALQLTGSAIGSVASLTGSAVSAAGSAAGNVAGSVIDRLDGDLLGDVDLDDTTADIRTALRDSEIDALQPAALEEELEAARAEIGEAFAQFRETPGEFDAIAGDLAGRLTARLDNLVSDIDRAEIVTALEANTDLTRPEAEAAADDAIAAYEGAVTEVRTQIENAEQTIATARADLVALEEEARVRADQAADALSSASLWAFFATLIGALVATFTGFAGARARFLMDDY